MKTPPHTLLCASFYSIVLTSIMLGLIGFSVLGPYSLLAGTFALELGGDRGTPHRPCTAVPVQSVD